MGTDDAGNWNGIVTLSYAAESVLVWNGDAGNNLWSADSSNAAWTAGEGGAGSYFSAGDSAKFTSDAANKTVRIAENIAAGTLVVFADYTFELTNGAHLTATKIDVESGSTLTISGDAASGMSTIATDLNGSGTIVFRGTSTPSDFTNIPSGIDDINLLTTSSDNAARTVRVESGVVWLGAVKQSVDGTYSLGTATTLEVASGATFVNNDPTLTLANLNLAGTFWEMDGTSATNAKALTITGKTSVSGADAAVVLYWDKLLDLGTLDGDSGATLTILGASNENASIARETIARLGNFSGSLVITGRHGNNTAFKLTKGSGASLEALSLTNSTFQLYESANVQTVAAGLAIGKVSVSGTGTIETVYYQSYVSIDALSGSGATLNLASSAATVVVNIFDLGANGPSAENNFTGTINLSDSAANADRAVSLVISDETIAQGAVVVFGSETSPTGSLSLGVNTERAIVAGLSSERTHTGADIIYSGVAQHSASSGDLGSGIVSDGTRRTLVVDVAAGASYDFYGKIRNNVNIEKSGAGAQILHDDGGEFDGSVVVAAGTLGLDGGFAMSSLVVDAGATLVLGGGDFSAAAGVNSEGAISIGDDATLSIVGDSTILGVLTLGNNATLSVSGGETRFGGLGGGENDLGSGNIEVGGGAILRLDVAISTTGTVAFVAGSLLALGDNLLGDVAVAALSDEAATAGEHPVITAEEIYFGGEGLSTYAGDVSELVNGYVATEAFADHKLSWNYDNGSLSVSVAKTPEPSMFGLLAGFVAIGFVATRRHKPHNKRRA
ncbi:MAG: hypothetical protein LUD52_06850 [Opitutae bacterium]|nr:hypothetical protein [Opitutae bacterium]